MNWYCSKKSKESMSKLFIQQGLRSDSLRHRYQANTHVDYIHRGPSIRSAENHDFLSSNLPKSLNWKNRHCLVKDCFNRSNKHRTDDPPRDRKETDSGDSSDHLYNDELNQTSNKFLHSEESSHRTSSHSSNCQFPMRLLWLRTSHLLQPKVSALLNRFDSEGLTVHIIESFETDYTLEWSTTCELIVLECMNTGEQDMISLLYDVRMQSRVPLIVLTDNLTLDWSLLALREGADAIFTLNTPDDIIVARSNALLRRWAPE